MSHPITGKRRSVIIYSFVWLIIAMIHGLLIRYLQQLPISIIVAEALISSSIFGVLGLLAWYPTRYIPFQRNKPVYSISAHVVAGLIVIFIWLLISVGLLSAVFQAEIDYTEFLNQSLVWRTIMGSLIYLTLVLIYYLVAFTQTLQERAKQAERLKGLVRDAELSMLKSQINPHFLFNSLNSISSLIMTNPEEARDMIIRLSEFLRYSLKHRENEYVPLHEEVGRMKDYMAIEKIRFGEKLQCTFEVPKECDITPVPTMIFQPLFENAIKHGVYESLVPINIVFRCSHENEFMKAVIVNNYEQDSPSRRGTGVGLQNVKSRIDLAYEGNGSIRWRGLNDQFTVTMFFPRIPGK